MKNIIEAIDHWGSTTPTGICYKEGAVTHTYQELCEKANRLAQKLASTFPNRKPIVVYGGLEFDMLVCFLACVKSGHAYIPIDSHTPNERIEMILNVAEPAGILAVNEWPEISYTAELLDFARILAAIELPTDEETVLVPVTGDEDFYIIFTSGTTGVPKGVEISHTNLCSFVEWMLADFDLSEGTCFLSQAPFSFDLSVMDLYPALTSGSSLTPLSKAVVNDFKTLFATLPDMDTNVWVSTPSFADICLMDESFNGQRMPKISHFLFCGEELTHQTASKLLERFPNARVFNTYGPTEATVAITEVEITAEVLKDFARLPIGRVKQDTQVVIMDQDGNQVPAGEAGEIVIVGPSVSKGYLNNPEKTNEAFFTYNGQQAYHTGDAGSFTGDLLCYRGRMDFQVKLNGYRIELEDIDHHLSEVSLIQMASVVPKYKDHKVHQLVAFVVLADNPYEKAFQTTNAIKKELAETVMDYMIPNKFIYVDQLPMTQNGKVDRKGLMAQVNES